MSSSVQFYKLEPVDAWFFRDGRPMNRGEFQGVSDSLFPPHAPTVVGAIRAALAREQGWKGSGEWPGELKPTLGDGFENLGSLSFSGPFMHAQEHGLLFVMPRHVLGRDSIDQEGNRTFIDTKLVTPSQTQYSTDAGRIHLPLPPRLEGANDKPLEPADNWFVTEAGLRAILSGKAPVSKECVHASALYTVETRIGIGLKESRTAEEGAVFHPRFIRLRKGVSLIMGIDGLPDGWTLPGLLPMGGESRMAACERIDLALPSFEPPQSGEGILISLTPAKFDAQPWYGIELNGNAASLCTELEGSIQAISVDRPLCIGGWDSRGHAPLPLEPYTPAGTVWWWKGTARLDTNKPLMVGGCNAYGFGLALLGATAQA